MRKRNCCMPQSTWLHAQYATVVLLITDICAGVKMPIHALFQRAILTRKVDESDLILVCNGCALVGLRVQHYKSPYTAVTISDIEFDFYSLTSKSRSNPYPGYPG